jgi:hypothetical protein
MAQAQPWDTLRELAASGLVVLADKGYHGAGDHIRTPYKGRNKQESQKTAHSAHAKLRPARGIRLMVIPSFRLGAM